MKSDATFSDAYRTTAPHAGDIRDGTVYRQAQAEIQCLNPQGRLIGVMLSIDDTPLTQHSGTHNGRPVYISTANQSLESRRKRTSNAWRVLALLPVLKLEEESKQSGVDDLWITHAKSEFSNRVLEVVLKPLAGKILPTFSCAFTNNSIDIMQTGFFSAERSRQYYPRLICCLSDLMESYNLWGYRHLSCPLCEADKSDFNVVMTAQLLKKEAKAAPKHKKFAKRPYLGLPYDTNEYEMETNMTKRLKLSTQMRQNHGYFPVRLAFSAITTNAWEMYIVDILHQLKKGIFKDLMKCLKAKAKKEKYYKLLKRRMKSITPYIGLEKFRRSWFDVSKITASNYRDIVSS